ncbi:gamma-glutamyltranspeptidase [Gluconacetobacter aggeris]|uniref:Gamma-glutamyltranspeptidase n=1 Tax=Gluconacetobacter aggeris TaxID=1286186 RepID=A0A7W4IUX2_9PROT|nr:gamma-glutamyltransferase [Gluconacetobacter aggeris]MBB2169516.1 gamma-glutamyltranspeptidase [Gluconacetobacter aggeris]
MTAVMENLCVRERPLNHPLRRCGALLLSTVLATALGGCSVKSFNDPLGSASHVLFGGGSDTPKGPTYLTGYIGNVVSDEPQSAMVARDVLARGGNAADAAAALGMTLAVTLPSRASLGAGGACVAWRPGESGGGRAFLFLPVAGSTTPEPGSARVDRPAAAPMLARGLYLMHLRYGSVEFAETLAPAMQLARGGISVSRALATDLAAVQGPLLADPGARAIFSRGDGKVLAEGDALVQQRLTGVLEQISSMGVGDLYNGALARSFVAGSQGAGGGLTVADLRGAVPVETDPLTVRAGEVRVSFLPPPADGGLGSAVAFRALNEGGQSDRAGQSAVAAWRGQTAGAQSGAELVARAQAVVDSGTVSTGGTLPHLPASTSFAVVDRHGGAVACSLTMDNLFGTGRIAGSTGIVMGASPRRLPPPLLTAAIASEGSRFRAAVTGSGQNDAADAVAAEMKQVLAGEKPGARPVTVDGRINAISCPAGLPGGEGSCAGGTDARSAGLSVGSD